MTTVAIPGGSRALAMRRVLEVQVSGIGSARLPVPSVAGAIVLKVHAWQARQAPRDAEDLVRLLDLVVDVDGSAPRSSRQSDVGWPRSRPSPTSDPWRGRPLATRTTLWQPSRGWRTSPISDPALANRTIIGAFTARRFTLMRGHPTPHRPRRLPKHVRHRCATPRQVSCSGSAWASRATPGSLATALMRPARTTDSRRVEFPEELPVERHGAPRRRLLGPAGQPTERDGGVGGRLTLSRGPRVPPAPAPTHPRQRTPGRSRRGSRRGRPRTRRSLRSNLASLTAGSPGQQPKPRSGRIIALIATALTSTTPIALSPPTQS